MPQYSMLVSFLGQNPFNSWRAYATPKRPAYSSHLAPFIVNFETRGTDLRGTDQGLHLVDIEDPTAPFELGFYPQTSDAWTNTTIEVEGTLIYRGLGNYLSVIDVSDPRNPFLLASHWWPMSDFVVGNGYLYTGWLGVLSIREISDPVNPQELGFLEVGSGINDLILHGRLMYVLKDDSIVVIDVTNPYVPTKLTEIEVTGTQLRGAVVDSVLAVHTSLSDPSSYSVRFFDISNPTAPVFLYEVEASESHWESSLTVHQNRVLLGLFRAGIECYSADGCFENACPRTPRGRHRP